MTVLAADWNAPGVTAFTTLRTGGTSDGPYESLNLATHVGDDSARVRQNRGLVRQSRDWALEPLWLDQVHGTTVVRTETLRPGAPVPPQADGAVTSVPGQPLVVMTADCLPVVACDRAGTVVGAFHAGWKGLLAGILEEGMLSLDRPASELMVWIGPCIGFDGYQVGPEVRDAYRASNPAHDAEFVPDGVGHWKFDLAGAAVRRLKALGVGTVTRSRWDTLRDADLFFSHRRTNGVTPGSPTGRMGTFICLEKRRPS